MRRLATILLLALLIPQPLTAATGTKVIAWNDLGMHCTDGTDYSVFGVLPPFNTVNAQVIGADGRLLRSTTGFAATYQAVADANGSINTTSVGKTNFWQYAPIVFGATLAADTGLAGSKMPGSANVPQPMIFDANRLWFSAVGVPITPIDDRGVKNYFPMMRIAARDTTGNVLATTDVVLPVSDEMDCRACHASGGAPAARPGNGWAFDADPARDVKLNVLALHDQHQSANTTYASALSARGFDANGLRATALGGKPILCASCHASNALGAAGIAPIQPLTAAVHSRHDDVVDPASGVRLGAMTTRDACYRCHPGAETKCLRGVMGSAVAPDGSYAIDCQSCHGSMSAVGAAGRNGWLQEPLCQSCHTGTATRYTSVFTSPGVVRTAADSTFATTPNQPAAGLSLYRFSTGHGGLQCEACHGSTHAEAPSARGSDNVQNVALQGHAGVLAECTACHPSAPSTVSGGPHGLHPLGSAWVSRHGDAAESGASACSGCHGFDYRGTVLSRARGARQLSTEFGAKTFWQGFQVGCYTCHDGPGSETAARNRPPSVSDGTAVSIGGTMAIPLTASDPDGNALTLRIVSQPLHGRAGVSARTAIYIADAGYSGSDAFTFAANDGTTDSNLGTISVTVSGAPPLSLRVEKAGSGTGVVTSDPAAINCGATCSASVAQGTTLTLHAQPDVNARFDGWSGPCTGTGTCTVTVNAALTVTATFSYAPSRYTLTVAKTGNGVVTSEPLGINCGTSCAATYDLGTEVRLTAVADRGSGFSGWSSPCGKDAECVVTMTQARTLTATFYTVSRPRPAR